MGKPSKECGIWRLERLERRHSDLNTGSRRELSQNGTNAQLALGCGLRAAGIATLSKANRVIFPVLVQG